MVRMEPHANEGRPSEARSRLLATAGRVFYAEGIHTVGVDRIVEEARVTRATFYRHFRGKENLVVAYLNEADRSMRAEADAAVSAGLPAADTLRALSDTIARGIRSPGFRGCAFLNAAAEYPDPAPGPPRGPRPPRLAPRHHHRAPRPDPGGAGRTRRPALRDAA